MNLKKQLPLLLLLNLLLQAIATNGITSITTSGSGETNICKLNSQIIIRWNKDINTDPKSSETLRLLNSIFGKTAQHLRQTASGSHVYDVGQHCEEVLTQLTARLTTNTMVTFAHPDYIMHAEWAPNDEDYHYQWNLHRIEGIGIHMEEAWDKSRGRGVSVAVLDTGYTPHWEYSNRILPGADFVNISNSQDGDGVDLDATDPGNWLEEEGTVWAPSTWHGTKTTGIIAAAGNNNDGLVGVAPESTIVPIRVIGGDNDHQYDQSWGAQQTLAHTSDIIDAMLWAIGFFIDGAGRNPNPVRILNLSLGGYINAPCPVEYQQAIDFVRFFGGVVIVSGGNDNKIGTGHTPSNCQGVIAVGATNRQGLASNFTNFGVTIDLAAPGGQKGLEPSQKNELIRLTSNSGNSIAQSANFGHGGGTSYSAPHVTGVVALMLGISPNLTPDEIELLLKKSAWPWAQNPGKDIGDGLLDAKAAVDIVDPTRTLTNGIGKNVTGNAQPWGDSREFFRIEVPVNTAKLQVRIIAQNNAVGNVDLYVKNGRVPARHYFSCKSEGMGIAELCIINNPTPGTWYILLQSDVDYSGASVSASLFQ